MDEGISVGIASHPIGEIPGLLRADGSPPLYYVVLHAWMAVFGTSETAVHALSLVISVAAIPVALWAGWSLVDRRTGVVFAALVASSPILSFFATEARMYALVFLFALVATVSFVHAFVFARRRHLWLFVPSLILVLYTHTWGVWMVVAAVVGLVPCALATGHRPRLAGDALCAFGAVALAYVPWIPTLAYQRAHTGAPWSGAPLPREAISVVDVLLGDPHERVLVALVLVAGPVLWVVLRRRSTLALAVATLGALAVIPVVVGWTAAQISPGWAPRYLAVCAPAVFLLAAIGLARARAHGLMALGVILAIWVQPFARLNGLRPAGGGGERASVKSLTHAVAPGLGEGDLVIAMQMEEVPVLAYYFSQDLRYATAAGAVADPRIADWRDALDRMREATVGSSLSPLLDRTEVGGAVLLLCAQPGTGPLDLPWFALMELRCGQWRSALEGAPRFTAATATFLPVPPADAARQVLRFIRTGA